MGCEDQLGVRTACSIAGKVLWGRESCISLPSVSFTREGAQPVWAVTNQSVCSPRLPATTLGLGKEPPPLGPHVVGHRPPRGHWLPVGCVHSVLGSSTSALPRCHSPTTGLGEEVSCQPDKREGLVRRHRGDTANRTNCKSKGSLVDPRTSTHYRKVLKTFKTLI